MVSRLSALLISLSIGTAAVASEPEKLGPLDDYADLLYPAGEHVEGLIRRGRVARSGDWRAWYSGDTARYAHGVLGDEWEAETLVVERAGERFQFTLGPDSVFEDLEPRIADLNNDGVPEFIAIKSYLNAGAAVALFGFRDGVFAPLAESEPIGSANRWLNPAGVADYDGDGATEIAVVRTPHIGGIIQHFGWDGGPVLRLERSVRGYSTHRIGSTLLALSITLDWNGDGIPDLMLPRQDHRTLTVVTWTGEEFVELAAFTNEARITTRFARIRPPQGQQSGSAGEYVIYGLEDGTVRAIKIPVPPGPQ